MRIPCVIDIGERRLADVLKRVLGEHAGRSFAVASAYFSIERLELAPYKVETFNEKGVKRGAFEQGREQALVGVTRNRYLKRFESSIEAFRISVRRALAFLNALETWLPGAKLPRSSEFQRAIADLSREDEEDDATPGSLVDELVANDEAPRFLGRMAKANAANYALRRIREEDGSVIQEEERATALVSHELLAHQSTPRNSNNR